MRKILSNTSYTPRWAMGPHALNDKINRSTLNFSPLRNLKQWSHYDNLAAAELLKHLIFVS